MKIEIFLSILLATTLCSKVHTVSVFTGQESHIDFRKDHPNPYAVEVKRTKTSTPQLPLGCRGSGRTLSFSSDTELMRLAHHQTPSYQQSIYNSLVNLDSAEEIVEFEVVEDRVYLVTTLKRVYFLKIANGAISHEVTVDLPENVPNITSRLDLFVVVIDFAPCLIFPNMAVLCTEGICKRLEGWNEISQISHATSFKFRNQRYIALALEVGGVSLYKLSASNQLESYNHYPAQFFGEKEVHIYDINAQLSNQRLLYALDFTRGMYLLEFSEDNPTKLNKPKKVINHANCFSFDINPKKFIVMNCLAGTSDYLLEATYESAHQIYTLSSPQYKYQTILDINIDPTQNFYGWRTPSSIRFNWFIGQKPYPKQYKRAGQILLSNSVQFRLKNENNLTIIYYATVNSLRTVHITQQPPAATCVSEHPTEEEYLIEYKSPCLNNPNDICSQEEIIKLEVWKHKQLTVLHTLLPTLLSFVSLIGIVVCIAVVYRRYNKIEEEVSIKNANSIDNDFVLDSGR